MRGWRLLLAVFAVGCAGSPPVPECDAARVESGIEVALSEGRAPGIADLGDCRVPPADLERRWVEAACTPEGGWRIGLADRPLPNACDGDDRWLLEGHRLGTEYRRLIQRLAVFDEETVSGFEQVRLTRERDLIRGIAQIKGWPLPESEESP